MITRKDFEIIDNITIIYFNEQIKYINSLINFLTNSELKCGTHAESHNVNHNYVKNFIIKKDSVNIEQISGNKIKKNKSYCMSTNGNLNAKNMLLKRLNELLNYDIYFLFFCYQNGLFIINKCSEKKYKLNYFFKDCISSSKNNIIKIGNQIDINIDSSNKLDIRYNNYPDLYTDKINNVYNNYSLKSLKRCEENILKEIKTTKQIKTLLNLYYDPFIVIYIDYCNKIGVDHGIYLQVIYNDEYIKENNITNISTKLIMKNDNNEILNIEPSIIDKSYINVLGSYNYTSDKLYKFDQSQ